MNDTERSGQWFPSRRIAGLHEPPERAEWFLPDYRSGEDDTWDRLGEDWLAIDGIHPDARVYVRWAEEGASDMQRPRISGISVAGRQVTTDALRAIPISRLENLPALLKDPMAKEFASDLSPLTREAGEGPEVFSKRVAFYYRVFAATSSKPTKDLADHAGVPLATMRTWIREARLRGELPPGTRGKAG